jgi:hypothetical protein
MAKNGVDQSWEEFLTPEILRNKLISASLYLAAFEMLKDSVVGRLRSFYTFGYDKNGDRIDPQYEQRVLNRNRSTLYASLSWLAESGAIDQDDLGTFENLKECRNQIAHDMPQLVLAGSGFEYPALFPDLIALLQKIETWWILNVEIPTNEDFDGEEIDEAGIIPGPVMTVKMMLDIALGSEAEANAYLKALRERRQGPVSELQSSNRPMGLG